MDKSYIFLKSPIGSGGEANIYTVRIRPELVAKVYKNPHGDYARKLAFMIANPPVDPLASSGRVSIAWATELVTDLDRVVGFLMPKLDTSKAKPIFQYYNPATRRKESPKFSYVSLMRTARNLARAVRSVHSRGYVIGDVNESNVLVAEDAIVTLVDTDSFQVNDGSTVYRCTVGKPEYTPPELQGVSFRDVDRSIQHDLFGLGVLIYQLLMEGTHPFGGVFTGQGEAPELKNRIRSGHFPHGRRLGVPYKPMPLAPSFQMLPVALQELFLLCFEAGHGNPALRPTADFWSKALGDAENGLVTCGVNGQHFYSGHLGVCPWCERAAKLGGRDPFPALGAIRSGQHLKPAAIGKAVQKPILKEKTKPSTSINTNLIPHISASTSLVNNSISLPANTPQHFQANYVSNQTLRKVTLWEALLNPTVSLIQRIVIFLIIPSWLCLSVLFLIVFIIVDIDTIWRVIFVGTFSFNFVAAVYIIFIMKTFQIIPSASGISNASNHRLVTFQVLWSIILTIFVIGSSLLSATFFTSYLIKNFFVSNIFMSGIVLLIVTYLQVQIASNILIFLVRKRILHIHLF